MHQLSFDEAAIKHFLDTLSTLAPRAGVVFSLRSAFITTICWFLKASAEL